MATCVDISGTQYPVQRNGEAIKPMEGVSLVPTFSGESLKRNAPLCFEHHGNLALRDGRWKIVSAFRRDQPTKWELYDMEADRTELNNLATKMPMKLNEMTSQWRAWADRVGVQKWPFKNKR